MIPPVNVILSLTRKKNISYEMGKVDFWDLHKRGSFPAEHADSEVSDYTTLDLKVILMGLNEGNCLELFQPFTNSTEKNFPFHKFQFVSNS